MYRRHRMCESADCTRDDDNDDDDDDDDYYDDDDDVCTIFDMLRE